MLNISENTILKILKYGIYASLLWFFLITKYTLYPAHTGKILFLFSLIEILFVFYVLLILKFPKYRPKINLMTGAIIIWGGALALSAIFGVDPWISFFSQFKRMTGLFFLAHIFAFFLIIMTALKTWNDWRSFLVANVIVGIANALFGIYQKINHDFFSWLGDVIRVSGIFGNPSLLASYLLFVLFFCLFIFLKSKNIKWKIFNISAFFIILIAILFAGTRGTIMGSVIGVGSFIIIYIFYSQNEKLRKALLIFLAISFLGVTLLLANKDATWLDNAPVIKRAVTISWEEFATSTRKMLWISSWNGFKDRPILGWGKENFNLIFDKYYNPQILNYGGGESWPTKPHNVFAEYLAEGGAIGISSFALLYIVAIFVLWRKIKKRQPEDLPLIVFVSLLMAHLVQNIVLFDTYYTYYMLAIVFGFIAFNDDSSPKQIFSLKFLQKDTINFIVASVAILVVFLIYMNIGTYRSAYFANNFRSDFININSWYGDDFRKAYIKFYLNKDFKFKDKEEEDKMLGIMNMEMDNVLKRHPTSVFDQGFKIQILTELGIRDPKYLDEAEDLLQESLRLSPNRQQLYLLLGRINFIKKDYSEALNNFDKAIELNPEAATAYWYLGIVHYYFKNIPMAMDKFDFAYQKGFRPETTSQLSLWALIYAENKIFDRALKLYDEAAYRDPENYEYSTKRAAIYKELGNKALAIGMANRAMALNPDLKEEAELFIKEVEKMPDIE